MEYFFEMASKSYTKLVKSLALAKNRKASLLFVAEGPKIVLELLSVFPCEYLAAEEGWLTRNAQALGNVHKVDTTNEAELHRLSFLQTPQSVVAVFRQPQENLQDCLNLPSAQLCLALDGVQNPGNVGTILRIADWFGIDRVFCSPDTADVFAPKVVQASMGALARIHVSYAPLPAFLSQLPQGTPVYGTFLDGSDVQKTDLQQRGVIVMGNEGNGIRPEVEEFVTERLLIPSFPAGRPTSESLNVAIATAIICQEFRRKA